MQPLFEHRRGFAGYETRVLELEGSGPPLLLLHGYADSADTWRPLLDLLARAERHAIAVDMPGFGTADRLRDGPILPQLEAFAGAAARDLAGGREEVVVAGNSLGGCVALLLAQRADVPLAGAVPIAPAGLDMARWLAIVENEPVLRALLAIPVPVPEPAVREAVGRAYRALAFARPETVERHVVDAFTGHIRDRRTVRRYLQTAHDLLRELDDPYELGRIGVPVRVLWGTRDRLVSSIGAQHILRAVPDAEIILFEGFGHCPQIEVPTEVAELLGGFPVELARAA